MKAVISTGMIVLALGFTACGGKDHNSGGEKEITTDVINNPNTASDKKKGAKPEIEFESDVFDFGEITQGEKVEHSFRFKNVGDAALIISSAKGSCGCTVPEWPDKPIQPGETAEIDVVFDSNGKRGRQNKTVTIVANTVPNTKVIALKGDVKPPETDEKE